MGRAKPFTFWTTGQIERASLLSVDAWMRTAKARRVDVA